MSEYSGIRGTRVKYLASDPTLNSSTEGQVWYNSTSGTLKSLVQIKAFSAGGNYPTGVYGQVGGAGTQTAGLAFGGRRNGVPTNDFDLTNEYSGYSWTSAPDLGTGRYGINGCGTQTAAIGAGGYRWPTPPTGLQTTVEEYDGSTWTAGTALPTGISSAAMNGLQTAALLSGGNSTRTEVLSYDGSTWTSEPALNAGRRSLRGAGTTTDAIVFGGVNPGAPIVYANTESFNGTSWTEVNNMNTPIYDMNAMGSSSSHVASNSGYNGTANTNITEEWDGTNWTTAPTSSVIHRGGAGFGTATAGISAVGGSSPYTATEEYVSSIDAYSPSVASAWASGGNLNTSRGGVAGSGVAENDILAFGGDTGPSRTGATEEYNGSAWSNGGSLPSRSLIGSASQGPTSAGLGFGGYNSGGKNNTDEYDGSTWTAGGTYGASKFRIGGFGIQTAAVGVGGQPAVSSVYEYDGSTWTAGTAYPLSNFGFSGTGILTAGIVVGGYTSTATANKYDGTSWTATGSLNTGRWGLGTAGVQTAAIFYGGGTGSKLANTETYDGTSFSTSASLATARQEGASGGTQSAAVFGGGGTNSSPSATAATEEFTEGSPITPTGAVASTLTTS